MPEGRGFLAFLGDQGMSDLSFMSVPKLLPMRALAAEVDATTHREIEQALKEKGVAVPPIPKEPIYLFTRQLRVE
jgi:hypothetical protein